MGRVYVFGSINMDIVAFARRRPGVGETVTGDELRLLPGGKGANQAVAARRAGADTALAGRVGDDPFAADLLRFLEAEGVELSLTCSLAGETSGTALIVVAEADNAIVVVPGANARLGLEAVQAAPIAAGDIVVAQFETPQKTTLAAFEKAAGVGATTILNPAPAATVAAGLLETSDIVVLNALELGELLGTPLPAAGLVAWAGRYGDALRMRDDQAIVVTLGAGGVVACSEGDPLHIVGKPVPTIDTTGAGDCSSATPRPPCCAATRCATPRVSPTPRRRSACKRGAPQRRCPDGRFATDGTLPLERARRALVPARGAHGVRLRRGKR